MYRSGELASQYETKKQEMQQAEEDTTFNYQKKKVFTASHWQYVHEKSPARRLSQLLSRHLEKIMSDTGKT